LGKLDLGLKRIDKRYLDDPTEKCGEIIEKFKDQRFLLILHAGGCRFQNLTKLTWGYGN
jgi:hypothetical protein